MSTGRGVVPGGAANSAMVLLYPDIGRVILERQEPEGEL